MSIAKMPYSACFLIKSLEHVAVPKGLEVWLLQGPHTLAEGCLHMCMHDNYTWQPQVYDTVPGHIRKSQRRCGAVRR